MSKPISQTNRYLYLAIAVHLVLLSMMITRQLDPLFNDASHRIGPGTDFWAYYNAGEHFLQGEGIYGQGPGMGYRYHPLAAMTLFAGLSLLGYDAAYYVWLAISVGMFFFLLFALSKLFRNQKEYLIALGLMTLFSPLYLDFYMGNCTFVSGGLLFFAVWRYQEGLTTPFLLWFMLSLFLKPIGLLLLPLLVWKKYRLTGIILALLVITGLPYFVWQSGEWTIFTHINLSSSATEPGFLVHGGNQGLFAFLLAMIAHVNDISLRSLSSISQLPYGGMVLAKIYPFLILGGLSVLTYRFRQVLTFPAMTGLWVGIYLLAYKDVWEHSYALVIIIGLLWQLGKMEFNLLSLLSLLLLALPGWFIIYDLPFPESRFYDPDWYWSFPVSLFHHAYKPLLFMLLMISFAVAAGRRRFNN